jgi:nitrogen fixation NifU-like protein
MEKAGNRRWDRVVSELQEEIEARERSLYSAKVLEQVHNPTNLGSLEGADAHASVQGWCGDTMEIYLRLNATRIEKATFMTDGCGPALACGNMLTSMVRGMTLEEGYQVTPEDLAAALDGLPEESAHCAILAVNTLRAAIGVNRWRDNAIEEKRRTS